VRYNTRSMTGKEGRQQQIVTPLPFGTERHVRCKTPGGRGCNLADWQPKSFRRI